MRWRRVPVYVLDSIPVFATVWGATFASMIALGSYVVVPVLSEVGYILYCLNRISMHNGEPAHIPIPWTGNARRAVPVEPPKPSREPRMWPPQPGYCYICGIHDPEREQTLGDATHPECKEWLGDWKPQGFVTGDQVRILTSPPAPGYTEAMGWDMSMLDSRIGQIDKRMGKLRQSIREADARLVDMSKPLPLAIPGFQYSWTCRCPVCTTYIYNLGSYINGHPRNCECTNCLIVQAKLAKLKTKNGPHHRNCVCTSCHLEQSKYPLVHDAWITIPGRSDVKVPCPCNYHARTLPPFEPDPKLTRRTSE